MDNNNTMEYRIGLEKQNKRNDQVTELILDNCRAQQISGLTEEFINLETLSLINVGLTTLKGFPKLPQLKRLELSDNRLAGGLNLLHGSPKLQHLNISGNRIKDLEALEPLKEFHELANLDLYNCEVTKTDDYRTKVFDLLPNLHSLDGYDRNEREVADSDESDDEGSDVENRIAREDNDIDEDDDEEGGGESSSDYDEEDEDDDIDNYNGTLSTNQEFSDDDDDDDTEGSSDEDDDEEDEDDDEVPAARGQPQSAARPGASAAAANEDDSLANGDDDDDEDDDDDDIDDEEGDGSNLKQLQKDIGEDEDSDDDDFEPSHEPDMRDYEIDPEDDADEDESAYLSTSGMNASDAAAAPAEAGDTKSRGQKRKHEDEGGDEKL